MPTPLTPEQSDLVVMHLHLLGRFVRRIVSRRAEWSHLTELDREGLLDALLDGLLAAAARYDPSRASFETHANWWMRGFLGNWIRDRAVRRRRQSGNIVRQADESTSDPSHPVETRDMIAFLKARLPRADFCLLMARHGRGELLPEMARRRGLVRQTVAEHLVSAMQSARLILGVPS